jgi:hypothetical protein
VVNIVNINDEPYDVFIGRPSKWGNPFKVGVDGTRNDVILKYREYIIGNTELYNDLAELEGKTLGCYCKPKSCHGDMLVELCNNFEMINFLENI